MTSVLVMLAVVLALACAVFFGAAVWTTVGWPWGAFLASAVASAALLLVARLREDAELEERGPV